MRDPLLLAVGAAVGAAAVATVAYVQRGAESDDVPTRRPGRLSDLVDDAEDAVDYLNWMTVSIATRLEGSQGRRLSTQHLSSVAEKTPPAPPPADPIVGQLFDLLGDANGVSWKAVQEATGIDIGAYTPGAQTPEQKSAREELKERLRDAGIDATSKSVTGAGKGIGRATIVEAHKKQNGRGAI